jgi:uncharacterized protein (TIGR01777 family)
LTGGTGFIGHKLMRSLLARGDEVTALTRRVRSPAPKGTESVTWLEWDPANDGPWQQAIDGQDAIVHLAGESVIGRRFTDSLRREALESRVGTAQRLVHAIRRARHRPRVFVSASGVGYYGTNTGDAALTEASPPGDDFLAQICVAWESAPREAEALGVRVVSTRFGLVLGRDGGMLGKVVPIFKAFVGGPLGDGKQPQPWVHIDDVVGALMKAIDDETLSGPVNVAAPNPVSNTELSRTLGKVLKRPSIMPAPAFALKALYGDGADPILTGQRALPQRLLEHGYTFRFTELEPALRDLLA